MNAIKTFFYWVRSSFYDPPFYDAVKNWPTKYAFYFLFFLCFISAFVVSARVTVFAVPGIRYFLKAEFLKNIPAELEVVIKDGKASTNVEEPYFIPVEKNAEIKNFLVIDRGAGNSIDLLEKYNSIAILTETHIFVREGRGEQIRVTSLSQFPNMHVSQKSIGGFIERYRSYAYPLLLLILIISIAGITVFSFIMYAAVLLFFAFVPLLISKYRKIGLSYTASYRVAVYALGPALVVHTLTSAAGVYMGSWLVVFLLFILVSVINIRPQPAPTARSSESLKNDSQPAHQ